MRIAEKMVGLVEPLAEWVAAGEYGMTEEEKVKIGMAVSWRLIGKCLQELEPHGDKRARVLWPIGYRLCKAIYKWPIYKLV